VTRLDAALVTRGLARSRGHARDLIDEGVVRVNDRVANRPSRPVTDRDVITIAVTAGSTVLDPSWVSRAAGKLLGALADLPEGGPAISGRRAADIGACTGGFTQVLLSRGAAEVLAVDVGHGQLAPLLASDPRVRDLSGHNVRDLTPDDVDGPVDLLVADLSFISLRLVMGRLVDLVRPGGNLLLLIKPQFEVGRRGLDGRGVVRPGRWRSDAVLAVVQSAHEEGIGLRAIVTSRTPGQEGNTEYVAWFTRPDATQALPTWQAVMGTLGQLDEEGARRPEGGNRA